MDRCETCTHWRSIADLMEDDGASSDATTVFYSGIGANAPEEEKRTWGHCTHIVLGRGGSDRAYTSDASDYIANLYCRSDFGCVEHTLSNSP